MTLKLPRIIPVSQFLYGGNDKKVNTEMLISDAYSGRSVRRKDDVNLDVRTPEISCENWLPQRIL